MSTNPRLRIQPSSKSVQKSEISDPSYNADKIKSPQISYLSPIHWVAFIFYVIIVLLWVMTLNVSLPKPLTSAMAGDQKFSEERAKTHFETLANFGPRPSNSHANDVLARNYIIAELEKIRANTSRGLHMDMDIQKPSGCYIISDDFFNCYKNVTNILVRLGKQKPANHSLLVNCHFDTVPAAPGATDDAISCAIMLELLNVFSKRDPNQLKYDLIFLFNGAEENYLQASHGFITKHPWRHSIRAFINLEGCGAGGREMLFQVGPGNAWLSHAYINNAPYPHCNVMAQELFENHFIPSDTDFRIFRDFGYLSGMDIAYINNGYVYHTEFDVPRLVANGSIQRSGENLFHTIQGILNSPCFTRPCPEQDTNLVFFDVLGYKVVSYPLSYATILNYALVALVIVKVIRKFRQSDGYSILEFLLALGIHFLVTCLMILTGCAMIQFAEFADLIMCWYSRHIMILPLYLIPTLIIGLSTHALVWWIMKRYKTKPADAIRLERASFDGALFILGSVLAILTNLQIASTYYVMIHVLFPVARDPWLWIAGRLCGSAKNATIIFLCHAIALFPIVALGSSGVLEVVQFFIPIMGRSGTVSHSEYLITAVCVACSVVIVLFMGGFVCMTKSFNEILKFMIFTTALMLAVAALTPFGSPYRYDPDAPRLRRIRMQHVSRTILNMDGKVNLSEHALYITGLDYRGVQDLPSGSFRQSAKRPPCVPEDSFCGLPYIRPSEETCPPENNLWIPVPTKPTFETPVKIQLVKREELAAGVVKMTFSIIAHDHATMFITPLNNWTLDKWSLTNDHLWPYRTYFIILSYVGHISNLGPWEFTLTLKKKSTSSSTQNQPKLLLGIASHYVHGPHKDSETTLALVNSIRDHREKPPTASFGYWKWMMTPDTFNSEYIAQYFA